MSTEAHDSSGEVDGTQVDKINTGALGTLVAVSLLAMLSITAAVTALVRHDMQIEEAQKDSDANAVVIGLKNSQRGMLNGPAGYVDRNKGLVSLPIDLATSLVLGDLQRDPNSATPAPPPKAEVAAATSTATAGTTADAGVTSTDAGVKPEAAGQGEPAKEKKLDSKPAPATSAKPAAATSAAPAPLPKPTPTAATPRAQEPGPLNH